MRMRVLFVVALYFSSIPIIYAQQSVHGKIIHGNEGVANATITIKNNRKTISTDAQGSFTLSNLTDSMIQLEITAVGFREKDTTIIAAQTAAQLIIPIERLNSEMNEVVISGTMKSVSRQDSPVPVEVYTSKYFKANPTPSLFDALQNINGVRPQLNCNICNTGDIHINGLEGPYTMILIDGMPIVSGLSTVYGLSGIPQSMIERMEVVKGPASTLYGSEAVGGLINVITQKPSSLPPLSVDVFGTSWKEMNADIATGFKLGQKANSMIGVNYFNYSNPFDKNNDGFTDVTLQNRFSIFNKWQINRLSNKLLSFAARHIYEDRWGGEMDWNKSFRGGDSVYGESIYTKRWELFGTYELPVKEQFTLLFSANGHDQNSAYGNSFFLAKQYIAFGQLNWNKTFNKHDLLAGASMRYTSYNDNTPATQERSITLLPGIFLQDEFSINTNNKILTGIRYDYNSIHGSIFSPRINYKWNSANKNNTVRISAGNGYRVANVFTEDHAALTGAREVVFLENLKPETSWNGNINFVKKVFTQNGGSLIVDATAFYTWFGNKIIPDYTSNSNKIQYKNLDGHAVSQGISLNLDFSLINGLRLVAGATYMDVYSMEDQQKRRQLFTEKFTGTWNIGYQFPKARIIIDYTGNVYSPMLLPLLSEHDPRSPYSPWWSIQNIQVTKKINSSLEIYGGIKNLLNWTPGKNSPFLIARANDPFDKQVVFGADGNALVTAENPYGLTFDPSYVYAPNQGIRGFLGVRWHLKK